MQFSGWNNYYGVDTTIKPKQSSTLDEITNRVFEELLQGKADNFRNPNAEPTPSIYVSYFYQILRVSPNNSRIVLIMLFLTVSSLKIIVRNIRRKF